MTSLIYESCGVSISKADVFSSIENIDKGLFPNAFCKIVPDVLTNDNQYCLALHSDGVGSKAIIAYQAYRNSGITSHFNTLAQDALVMNIDDLLCIGATGPFIVSNIIDRNKNLISGNVIKSIIEGYQNFSTQAKCWGIDIHLCGGETADLGDIVRTLTVNATAVCRMKKEDVIDGSKIEVGDLILGLSSTGQATYEDQYNSGIGSNGLTLARYTLLRDRDFLGIGDSQMARSNEGPYYLSDYFPPLKTSIENTLLSPTRTYIPVVKKILEHCRKAIHGIVHCTGGGQTKCLKFLRDDISFVKDNLFSVPPIFGLIKGVGNISWREMYQVFNMGYRMELFVDPVYLNEIIDIPKSYNIEAKVIGRVEESDNKSRLDILTPGGKESFFRN